MTNTNDLKTGLLSAAESALDMGGYDDLLVIVGTAAVRYCACTCLTDDARSPISQLDIRYRHTL